MGVCGGEATGESCCFVVAHLYEKRTMYQCKVDVDMLNAVKSVLADVSSIIALRQNKDGPVHKPIRIDGKSCRIGVIFFSSCVQIK